MRSPFAALALTAGLVAVALTAARTAQADGHGPSEAADPTRFLTVSGEGLVDRAPDTASITLGVVTLSETATAALEQNNETMRGLMAELEAAGIEKKDLQTTNFSISPQYQSYKSAERNQPPKITGYQVSNQLVIVVRQIDTFGTILDKAVSLGANSVGGISFFLAESGEAMDAARRAAMQDAKARAGLLAEEAGVAMKGIISIDETGASRPIARPMARMAVEASFADEVPLAGGEQTYRAGVTVVFEIE
ncbi:MAG: SIMPL domain-containing protein [Pseudomonadota bacterium]